MIGDHCFHTTNANSQQKLSENFKTAEKHSQSQSWESFINVSSGFYSDKQDFFSINLQVDEEISAASIVSFEMNILTEHLECLQALTPKITRFLFKITEDQLQLEILNYNYHQNEYTLTNYLLLQKSMISANQIPFFVKYLRENPNLRKLVNWIFEHVQSQLGDELILIVHRIILAYLPVKQFLSGSEHILEMSNNPFNLQNIFCDPRLKLLSICHLHMDKAGNRVFNVQLYEFYQVFLQTILLVLEQYFQNPAYTKIKMQKEEQLRKTKAYEALQPKSKKKKITKLKNN